MSHTKSDTHVKYMSVFFHVYHIDKILASIKEVEHFDNASIGAHVNIHLSFHYLHRFLLRLHWIRSVIMLFSRVKNKWN